MQIPYIRPEKRFSAAKQRTVLVAFGCAESRMYEESERSRGDDYPIRDAAISSIRPGGCDKFVVSHFHRLASTVADLAEAVRAIVAKGAVIVEASTGRKSINPADLVDMLFEAVEYYAQRGLTPAEASKIAKKAAAASPVTKPRKGRMPLHMVQEIMNDHSLTVKQALAKINRDRQYKTKYSHSLIYRLNREGQLKLRPRLSGRLPGRDI